MLTATPLGMNSTYRSQLITHRIGLWQAQPLEDVERMLKMLRCGHPSLSVAARIEGIEPSAKDPETTALLEPLSFRAAVLSSIKGERRVKMLQNYPSDFP